MIASIIPYCGAGNTLPLSSPTLTRDRTLTGGRGQYIANFNALAFDYV
jgi:hypothetical protein